jgi:hypothetical protein
VNESGQKIDKQRKKLGKGVEIAPNCAILGHKYAKIIEIAPY